MALSDGDWTRLDQKFAAVHEEIKSSGSKIHRLEVDLVALKAGSPHKCEEAIKAHEDGAWTHNPKKAISLLATIVGIGEGIRAFFHK